ncbi:MAG: HAD hydrolase-like protein [Candidatus Moraniibacteriota bacterium]
MQKSPIIFDFDGTIADTLPVFLEFARKEGVRFDGSDVAKWRDLSLRELIETLGIPRWKLPFIAWKFHRYFRKAAPQVRCKEGVIDVIRSLQQDGHILGIVTSNSRANVRTILSRENAVSCFSFVRSEWSVFGKARSLRRVVRRFGIGPDASWYVGDEVRDVEAARGAELRSAAVTWGFNSEKVLRSVTPDLVITEPRQLLEL